MKKPLLMLAEGEYFSPIDYREILKPYKMPSEAVKYVEEWLHEREEVWRHKKKQRQEYTTTVQLATELQGLQVGEYIAEFEADSLVEYYFVDTKAYNDALEGTHSIFVGRKGAGKSANLIKLESQFGRDVRNVVCVIKPETYEFQSIVKLLATYKELDLKGFAVESLWKFIIYTEIANAAARQIEARSSATWDQHETRLIELLEHNRGMLRDDIAIRLERCVQRLFEVANATENPSTVEGSRLAISEVLHDKILSELRNILGRVLSKKNLVAVLIDNLDRAWDRQSNLDDLAQMLIGLLGIADKIKRDLKSENARQKGIKISLAIFLRSDIFYKVMETVGERDKITYTKLNWNDEELLLRVIDERFATLHAGNIDSEGMWKKYFCERVNNLPVKEYIISHILPRPRDIVFFIKAAVTIAVNRKHTIVQEVDTLEAEKQYSQFALDSVLVENGITVHQLESIIYEFIGANSYLTRIEIEQILKTAGIAPTQHDYMIDHLCSLAFLGLEVNDNDYRFVEDQDPQEYKKLQVLARKLQKQKRRTPRYMINRPFWAYLEIKVGISATSLKSRPGKKQTETSTLQTAFDL